MAKAKEAPLGYDAEAEQSIPLDVTQNGRTKTARHHLSPLTNERYFEFQESVERDADRLKTLSTDIYRAKDRLWCDLVKSVEGYVPRDDFKQGVHQSHRIQAINALTEVLFTDPDGEEESEFIDIDANVTVPFSASCSGVLYANLSLTFRPESKAEMDHFFAITANQLDSNKLASAEKKSRMERLYELGKGLLVDRSGYKDGSEVPAWHIAPATEIFFVRQIAQAGKVSA